MPTTSVLTVESQFTCQVTLLDFLHETNVILCLSVYCGDVLFADCLFLFKQTRSVISHWKQYYEIKKKYRSVRLFVTQTINSYSIIDSRIIIRISGERTWHPLSENEAIFFLLLTQFFSFQIKFSKIYVLVYYFCVIGGRMIFYILGERNLCPLQ